MPSHTRGILGSILYSMFTADLSETEQTLTATYADDIAILASHQYLITASRLLQHHLNRLEQRLKRWRIQTNKNKSTQVTFALKRDYPAVTLTEKPFPQGETVKYLGIHLDRRLIWQTHVFTKRDSWGLYSCACTGS
jgi:hypothetical protein